MDRVLTAAYALTGESPPDRLFVRFDWLELDDASPVIGGGLTSIDTERDGVLIQSDVHLVEEHELIHAMQLEAWPRTNDFMAEGHAVLLDPKRVYREAFEWPQSRSLDELIEAEQVPTADYDLAWFVVSQVVLDHGFAGLRDLWHAVPRGSSAADVRSAYESLFSRSMDALIEPYVVEVPEPVGPTAVERQPCDFSLCPAGEPEAWVDGRWTAPAPFDCESDPDAIGPDVRLHTHEYGEVWRDYTMLVEWGYHTSTLSAGTGTGIIGCALECEQASLGIGASAPGPATMSSYGGAGRPARVEVRAALGDLPTEMPGTFEIADAEE